MNRNALLVRTLVYHGRNNLAVLLAAAVGTAVLAGALLVGDSLKGSLHQRAEDQLNGIDRVLIAPKFFRETVAEKLNGLPALMLQGNVVPKADSTRRVGKVTVVGLPRLLTETDTLEGVALSQSLAEQLNAKPGDMLELSVQKASAMPRSSVLGRRGTSDTTQTISLKVGRVLPPDHPGNVFQLNPAPGIPANMFVPLKVLQESLNQPERINAIFQEVGKANAASDSLQSVLSLDDWGIKVQIGPKQKTYINVESLRLVLEPTVVKAVEKTAKDLDFRTAETFVYLTNSIRHEGKAIPYSIIAGLDPTLKEPLGPFLPAGNTELKDGEIVLVDWRESPLKAKPGDSIEIEYFEPEIEGDIKTAKKAFRLKGFVPLEGVTGDPDLTPAFPGITDKLSLSNWDPPFPYEQSRIKPADENYWRRYKTTPKAYITLKAAREMFGSRFGDTTSIRIAPTEGLKLEAALAVFSKKLLENLDPKAGGFAFEPIRERLLNASSGSNDFGLLFLGFSFFLIVSALLLVGLMFRLNVERRSKEFGLLAAIGYAPRQIRAMLASEGLLLAILGSLLGLAGAIAFAGGMLYLLKILWPDGSVRSFLRLHVNPVSLLIGFVASVGMSYLAIRWASRGLAKIPPAMLLKGATANENESMDMLSQGKSFRWLRLTLWAILLGGLVCLLVAPYLPAGEPRAGSFFSGGSAVLIFFLGTLWIRLHRHRFDVRTLAGLSSVNQNRNPTRSLLTAGLLASAAFLLVAVESFRRQPESDFSAKTGGSGGFGQILELDAPIFVAPDSKEFTSMLSDALEKQFQSRKLPADERATKLKQFEDDWKEKLAIYPFRVRAGDDASCLNLFQATNPRVLGASSEFIRRGGFVFDEKPEGMANPWEALETDSSGPVPVFAEANTAQWMLKKSVGDVFTILDENGATFEVKLAGTLKDSPFQSEILMGDSAFKRHYPHQEGSTYFLLDLPEERRNELLSGLSAYGPTLSSTRDRVANYLAVENTYLTTFQLLGGLGMLLGVLGLAAVLLRNILERRSELALLSALGYSSRAIRSLLDRENIDLFVRGLLFGLCAALVGILPATRLGDIPWLRLGVMLTAVFLLGLIVIRLAIRSTLRQQIVAGLRRE